MIEAISHLIHRDYEAIVQDFITLRFIPKGEGCLFSWTSSLLSLQSWCSLLSETPFDLCLPTLTTAALCLQALI